MKKVLILAAGAMLLTSLAASSAFADQRDPQRTWRDGQDGYAYGYGYGDRADHDREIRGVVVRVHYHLRYLILREFDGDYVKVDMRPVARFRREPDIDDIHRGDVIAISGDWREGLFRAERVDRIRSRW